MRDELRAENLEIQIIGVNEFGQQAGNELIPDVSDLPWLQDVDENGDGESDIWSADWSVVYRDVVIVDRNNVKLGAFNVTEHNLADPENYGVLKQTLARVAAGDAIWRNDANPMDTNHDGVISAVGDVLPCVNELNEHFVSDARGVLPVPAPRGEHAYFDLNGDYRITPVGDVLPRVNYLNSLPAGEGEAILLSSDPSAAAAFPPDSDDSILPDATEVAPGVSTSRGGTKTPVDRPRDAAQGQRPSKTPARDTWLAQPSSGLDVDSEWTELLEDLSRQWYSA